MLVKTKMTKAVVLKCIESSKGLTVGKTYILKEIARVDGSQDRYLVIENDEGKVKLYLPRKFERKTIVGFIAH